MDRSKYNWYVPLKTEQPCRQGAVARNFDDRRAQETENPLKTFDIVIATKAPLVGGAVCPSFVPAVMGTAYLLAAIFTRVSRVFRATGTGCTTQTSRLVILSGIYRG